MASVRRALDALTVLDGLLPRVSVLEESCSRGHDSGCTACLDACPVGALLVGGEHAAPSVDPQACLACGICVVACPTGAVTGAGVPPSALVRVAGGQDGLEVGCSRAERPGRVSGPGPRSGVVACLASLHPETVAAAAAALAPGGTLTLAHGDCADCPVGAVDRVAETLAAGAGLAARVAPDRKVSGRLAPVPPGPPASGPGAHDRAGAAGTWAAPRSRRSLLGRSCAAADPDLEQVAGPVARAVTGGGASLARDALLAVAPSAPLPRPFAVEGCTTCGACSRVCSVDALRWSETASMAVLEVDEAACTACGECVRVCPEDVLGLGCTTSTHSRPCVGSTVVTRVRSVACERCGARLRAGEHDRCSRCATRGDLLADVWSHYEADASVPGGPE